MKNYASVGVVVSSIIFSGFVNAAQTSSIQRLKDIVGRCEMGIQDIMVYAKCSKVLAGYNYMLLTGPSGSGKTAKAEATAKTLNFKFFPISAASLGDEYQNSTRRQLEDVVAKAEAYIAKTKKPAMIFIDEAHIIIGNDIAVSNVDKQAAREQLGVIMSKYEKSKKLYIILGTYKKPEEMLNTIIRRIKHIVDLKNPEGQLRAELFQTFYALSHLEAFDDAATFEFFDAVPKIIKNKVQKDILQLLEDIKQLYEEAYSLILNSKEELAYKKFQINLHASEKQLDRFKKTAKEANLIDKSLDICCNEMATLIAHIRKECVGSPRILPVDIMILLAKKTKGLSNSETIDIISHIVFQANKSKQAITPVFAEEKCKEKLAMLAQTKKKELTYGICGDRLMKDETLDRCVKYVGIANGVTGTAINLAVLKQTYVG